MRSFFGVVIFFSYFSVLACEPSTAELNEFLEGVSQWTEVKDQNSFDLASSQPVFLNIPFADKSGISIKWGEKEVRGKEISLCWESPDKKALVIRRRFF